MSILIAQPDALGAVAQQFHVVNAGLRAGNSAAAGPTTGVVPAAADLVSALIATQFASHAQLYQDIGAMAAELQEQFATVLNLSASSYAASEAANGAIMASVIG